MHEPPRILVQRQLSLVFRQDVKAREYTAISIITNGDAKKQKLPWEY